MKGHTATSAYKTTILQKCNEHKILQDRGSIYYYITYICGDQYQDVIRNSHYSDENFSRLGIGGKSHIHSMRIQYLYS